MRYLVTNNQTLFNEENPNYKVISVEESLSILHPLKIIGLDTETEGFDVYTKRLKTVQLGNFDNQVMIDCESVDITLYKDYLESNRLFLLWNAKFDLKFFYHKRILIHNVWDGYLAEKLLWLGFPYTARGLGLKDAAYNYLGIVLDKTVRGKIHYAGLSDDVIIYGCNDVKYLEKIKECQDRELDSKDLQRALEVENEFVIVLAYIEYCGVRLDVKKWKEKMYKDSARLKAAEDSLNNWLVNYCLNHPELNTSTVTTVDLTVWDIKNGNNYELDSQRAAIKKKKGARRIPTKDTINDEIVTEVWAYPNKNPWIVTQVQADLFSTELPKAKCLVNWSSGKQVIPIFETLGFNLMAKDKETGEWKKSVEAKVIEPQKDLSSLAPIYLEYKAAEKVVSTYGQNFLDQINPVSHRIHTQFSQLTDTGRLSCGGKNKQTGEEYLNLQNLPNDAETRSCFIASEGSKWISIDYSGQESVIIAEVSQDKAMIEEFLHGSGDMHSLVAKAAFPEIIGDTPVKEIKKKFHSLRNDTKSQVEFPINYGGSAMTIHQHSGKSIEESQRIYDNYMNTFTGVKKYQDFCRKDVMEKGYIILNPLTKHRANIYDFELLKRIRGRFDSSFWDKYRFYKGQESKQVPGAVLRQLYERFADGEDFEDLQGIYEYEDDKKKHKTFNITIEDVYIYPKKYYFKRKAASEKQSINYRIQGTGALCFKLASIKFFNWLCRNNLLFTVKYVIPVHDNYFVVVKLG